MKLNKNKFSKVNKLNFGSEFYYGDKKIKAISDIRGFFTKKVFPRILF